MTWKIGLFYEEDYGILMGAIEKELLNWDLDIKHIPGCVCSKAERLEEIDIALFHPPCMKNSSCKYSLELIVENNPNTHFYLLTVFGRGEYDSLKIKTNVKLLDRETGGKFFSDVERFIERDFETIDS